MSANTAAQGEKPLSRKAGVDTCWHVAVLAALTTFITTATLRNGGIIFVGLVEQFGTNREHASWPISVQVTALQSAAVVVVLLQQRVSMARIAIFGSVLLWIGLVASAFVPSIAWMCFTYGLIHGGGKGTTLVAINTILLPYFDKYRGVASGIRYAGETCSGLLFPKLLVLLENTYGFQGMLLILGAILINATAFVCLLDEPPWLRYPQRNNTVNPNHHDEQSESVAEGIEGSADTPHSIPRITSVFCKPMFFIIVLLGVIIHYTHNVFLSTIVDFAMDRGMSLDTASSLIVYSSLTDFVGSLGLPLFADKKVLRRSTLVMWSYALLGTCLLLFSVVRAVRLFVLLTLIVAMLAATLITMKAVLMADYLGAEMIPITFAVTGLVSIPLFLCSPLIVGLFRDKLGSYDNLYTMVGGMNYFMALLFFGVFIWEHRNKEEWTLLN